MEKKNAVYTIMEEQSPEEARREHILLIARNFAAGAAAVLFLASFALADIHKLLRAAAYFLGAGAYFSEILVLTDGFRRKVPRKELFMAVGKLSGEGRALKNALSSCKISCLSRCLSCTLCQK